VEELGPNVFAIMVHLHDQPGVLHDLTKVISAHNANIAYVDITERHGGVGSTYFELEDVADPPTLIADLRSLQAVIDVEEMPSFWKIFGKRIIVIGGGAQVGQVVLGAVSEADRHNIRGERISVDTIPLVGEKEIAAAVRAVGRLHRARAIVLAGSLMGGEITEAVREVQKQDIVVVSLNMVGTVPDVADLVVTDPVQAGVMAVMHVASTARFDISRQQGRRY
jgi:energy-converting hydrogenase B subunit Q